MARDCPVTGLGRTFADHDLGGDEGFAAACGTGARSPERPPGAQTGRQFLPQRSAALNVKGLINCLVTDPHRGFLGEIKLQSARDLLGTPGSGPPSRLARSEPTPFPRDLRTLDRHPIWPSDQTRKTVLHIVAKKIVRHQFRHLRPARRALGMPLSRCRPVRKTASPGRCVAPEFARDGRWIAIQFSCHLTHPKALDPHQRNVLALLERKVAPGGRPGAGR